MQIIWFVFVGFIAGLLARAIMPGRQPMGVGMTTLLGILGSFLGGFFANLFFHRGTSLLQPSGIIGSVIGALAVLGLWMVAMKHRPVGTSVP
jgi:uncharacterized membrane protein YeaQ/YmgE (transglycosylase-associated protein family)